MNSSAVRVPFCMTRKIKSRSGEWTVACAKTSPLRSILGLIDHTLTRCDHLPIACSLIYGYPKLGGKSFADADKLAVSLKRTDIAEVLRYKHDSSLTLDLLASKQSCSRASLLKLGTGDVRIGLQLAPSCNADPITPYLTPTANTSKL